MFKPSVTEISDELIEFVSDVASANGYAVSIGPQGGRSFQKKTEESWINFGFGILDYGEVKTISGFSTTINLPRLEKITHPILKEFRLMGGDTKEFRQTFWPPHSSFKNNLNESLDVTDIAQLNDVKLAFKTFILEDALPFFKDWAHLEKAYELALQYDERDSLSKIFGPHWEFQKAALLHIFKNVKYVAFIDKFCAKREKIFQEYPDEEIAAQYYRAAFALRETLSKIQ